MLWRSAYRTLVARDLALPPVHLAGGDPWPPEARYVLLGGFDLRAYRQMQIWLRLLQAEATGTPTRLLFLRPSWDAKDLAAMQAMIPESLASQTYAALEEGWRALIDPDTPERAFAAIVENERSSLTMKGAPTEEAWDAFLEALREGN